MSEIKLKPCPFCGGEAEIQNRGIVWVAICKSCGAVTTFMPTEQRAANIWNKRDKPAHWHIKLKFEPCPFCGNTIPEFHKPLCKKQYTVRCANYLCGVHIAYQSTKQKAKEVWDRRV